MKITKIFLLSVLAIALFSCKNDDEEISAALPTISTITPASATVGSLVIINGSNFSADMSQNKVRFFHDGASENGIITNAEKNTINTRIPENLAPGEYLVEVMVDGKTAVASNKIVIMEGTSSGIASVSSIAPLSGEVESELIISGLNFSTGAQTNQVSFVKEDNSLIKATVISATSTRLKVKVPQATPGIYSIRVEIGETILNVSTKYTVKPSITVSNFYPTSGEKGSVFSIEGSNFSLTKSENSVYFISYNNVASVTVLAATATSLQVEVPGNILLGDFIIKVTVNGKSSSTNIPFRVTPTVLPTIAGFSTSDVYPGATLTINGSNFGSHPEYLQVSFLKSGSVLEEKAVILDASNNHITFLVPSIAAGSYNLKVYKYGESIAVSGLINSVAAPFTVTGFTTAGSSVELSGSGFKTTIEENIVEFVQGEISISAEVLDASASVLEVAVPSSLKGTYYIKVTIDHKSVTLNEEYFAQ